MLGGASPGQHDQPIVPPGYDPNIDIVQACIYGAVACTDTKLLATAAQLIAEWADPDSPEAYPVNLADAKLGLGPLLGRYPGDIYDGGSDSLGRHPWPLCTANFAQLYYELANEIVGGAALPLDELSAAFFAQIGVTADTSLDVAVEALQDAGDAMLRAVVYHSDHLELSEQFDGSSGYEKSVRDLTWSYASFLSAVRARTGQPVEG
jgi:glucoamylase